MDYKAVTRINSLVTSLTDCKISTLDDGKLKELKGVLRNSDELVSYAHELLFDRLAANHAQTRKAALQICDVLFSRSRCFRRQITAHFSQFVELTVGNKPDKPLPAPASVAVDLRQKSLEVIEKWHGQWGLQYPQVTLAYKYLKKHYNFPELASRAAAAAAAEVARQQRRQHLLQQRYQVFSQEFPQQQQQFQSLLHQMQECFDLLQQPVEQIQQEPASAPALPAVAVGISNISSPSRELVESAPDAGDGRCVSRVRLESATRASAAVPEDQEWEDVLPAEQLTTSQPGSDAARGVEEFDDEELVGDFQPDRVPDPDDHARQTTVLEQLADLARQAHLATSKQLLVWLRLLSQLQVHNQQQQQQWQQDLKAVVELRVQLQAAMKQAADWGVKQADGFVTAAGDQLPAHAVPEQQSDTSAAAAAAQGVQPDVPFMRPDSSESAGAAEVDLGNLPSRGPRPLDIRVPSATRDPAAGGVTSSISFASRLRTHQEPQQQQKVQGVYANIQDPTAAARGVYIIPKEVWQRAEEGRWVQQQLSDSDSEQREEAAGQTGLHDDDNKQQRQQHISNGEAAPGATRCHVGGDDGKSVKGLDPGLRQKLMASAPKLAIAGDDWLIAQHGVMSHGMELYNHWGAVDSTVAIPQDRLKELVGYTASYYKPSKKRKGAGVVATTDCPPAAGHNAATVSAALSDPQQAAAKSGTITAAARERVLSNDAAQWQSVADAPKVEDAAAAAAGSTVHSAQRSKPEGIRIRGSAHNRALLAAASGDEGLAAAIQQQLQAEAARARGRKGRTAKVPETKAEKLRKKLLGGR